MSEGHKHEDLDEAIVRAIGSLPEREVPEGFSRRVMDGLRPKRPTWRSLLWSEVMAPQKLTFRPAYALALALVLTGLVFWSGTGEQQDAGGVPVRFVLHDAGQRAGSVAVVGTFNGWQAGQSTMRYDAETGTWVLEATLPPGDHEYMFLVDGDRLVTDPGARMTRDDGFGNRNAILFVGGADVTAL